MEQGDKHFCHAMSRWVTTHKQTIGSPIALFLNADIPPEYLPEEMLKNNYLKPAGQLDMNLSVASISPRKYLTAF